MTLTLGGKGRKFRKIERLVPNVQFGACDLSAWSWGAPCSWQAPAQSSVAAGDRKANLLTSKCAHAEQTCCSRPPITTAASQQALFRQRHPCTPHAAPTRLSAPPALILTVDTTACRPQTLRQPPLLQPRLLAKLCSIPNN